MIRLCTIAIIYIRIYPLLSYGSTIPLRRRQVIIWEPKPCVLDVTVCFILGKTQARLNGYLTRGMRSGSTLENLIKTSLMTTDPSPSLHLRYPAVPCDMMHTTRSEHSSIELRPSSMKLLSSTLVVHIFSFTWHPTACSPEWRSSASSVAPSRESGLYKMRPRTSPLLS